MPRLFISRRKMGVVTLPELGINVSDYCTAGLGYITAALGTVVGISFAWLGLNVIIRKSKAALKGK